MNSGVNGKDNKEDKDNNSNNNWISYVGLGTQLAITVTAMAFLGLWLDHKFNTEPILTVISSFVGITAGLYNFIKTVLK